MDGMGAGHPLQGGDTVGRHASLQTWAEGDVPDSTWGPRKVT